MKLDRLLYDIKLTMKQKQVRQLTRLAYIHNMPIGMCG